MSDKLSHFNIFTDLKWLRVVDGVRIKGAKLSVLTMLLSYAGWEHWTCFPSYTALAESAGVTKDTAKSTMRELIALDLVAREDRGDKRRTNIYTINVARIHEIAMEHKASDAQRRKAANLESFKKIDLPPEHGVEGSDDEYGLGEGYADSGDHD